MIKDCKLITCDRCGKAIRIDQIDNEPPRYKYSESNSLPWFNLEIDIYDVTNLFHTVGDRSIELCPNCYNQLLRFLRR